METPTDEDDIEASLLRGRLPRPERGGERDDEEHHAHRGEEQPALPAEVPDGGDLPAVRAARQRVVQRVEEEVVVAVRAVDAAHARHVGHGRRGDGLVRGQADHALAVRPGARNALKHKFKVDNVKQVSQSMSFLPCCCSCR